MLRGEGCLLSKLRSLFLQKKKAVPHLPDELLLEIFIRLPAKSTFTCKCVSKKWFSIISNPDFVKLHLNHTLKFNNNSRFMVSVECNLKFLMYDITKDSLFSTRNWFSKALGTVVGTLGSCNGLVCLEHAYPRLNCFFTIWNPATKEYKRVPDSDATTSPAFFCYDCKNDDYKIVSISNSNPSLLLDVYSLSSDSWKCIPARRYSLGCNINGVLVNGALHWITDTQKCIVCFDISDETFKEIQLPREITEEMPFSRLDLKVLEGCLCVVHYMFNKAWVMREYGVFQSWRKHQNKTVWEYEKLMWSSENGECLIYKEHNDLVLYDLKHSIARRINIGHFIIRRVDNYVATLVSLGTGAYMRCIR